MADRDMMLSLLREAEELISLLSLRVATMENLRYGNETPEEVQRVLQHFDERHVAFQTRLREEW